MDVRRVACDPCRKSKLACDHRLPACGRCTSRGKTCSYRSRPFRRRLKETSPSERSSPVTALPSYASLAHTIQTTESPIRELPSLAPTRRYPNPGFLGAYSHSAIFNQVSTHSEPTPNLHHHHAGLGASPVMEIRPEGDPIRAQDIDTLSRLSQLDVQSLARLLEAWTVTGANLALAQPFVRCSTTAVLNLCKSLASLLASPRDQRGYFASLARKLAENTRTPIDLNKDSTIDDFAAQLSSNLRWEVIGFFVTAVGRACVEIPSHVSLFTNGEQRRRLARTLVSLSDACLESCRSLDTLTDLQLVLQFEVGILHSQVDGDQSLVSWRGVGDAASSLFALGLHEQIVDEDTPNVPYFLAELRKACFARIYAADKELAIFLGRPPRIIGEYCVFQAPEWSSLPWHGYAHDGNDRLLRHADGSSTPAINYTADTRRSALFARLKEEIMQLLRNRQRASDVHITTELRRKIHAQWESLPANFRLTTPLKECRLVSPFERDFLAATRLEFLHTNFLLDLSSQRKVSEPDEVIINTAAEMLSLVVELIILRDSLANSGSSLVWKVAHFGLPAAGIISLALLNTSIAALNNMQRFQMLQNLTILHAEITVGAWIQAGDANYSLFERATNTIKILLESKTPWGPDLAQPGMESIPQALELEQWDPYSELQPWDFEMDFWTNLAEHPTLLG